MITPLEKGNELENAVKAIEHVILQSSPSLEKASFLIESKKIVVIEGVRHEIDVWVEIDHGKGYKSIFIFECKNWKDSVGKNEIIIFSEKIDAVQAQCGFFVAKSFTKDAGAQANKDKRISLFSAKEHSPENTPTPFNFHFVLEENKHSDLFFKVRNFDRKVKLDIDNIKCQLKDKTIDLNNYIQDWIKDCADKRTRTFPSGEKAEGVYELEADDERCFGESELVCNKKEIEKITLHVTFSVRILRPGIASHYEVESRGRMLSLAPVQLRDGGHIQVHFASKTSEA
jgi:hypothetical protein